MDENIYLNPGYFKHHTANVYLTNSALFEIQPPFCYHESDSSYEITKYPKDGSINKIEDYYVFPKRSVFYIRLKGK